MSLGVATPGISGLRIALTGKMPAVRSEIEEAIAACGGEYVKTVKDADVLVVGLTRGETTKLKGSGGYAIAVWDVEELHHRMERKSPMSNSAVIDFMKQYREADRADEDAGKPKPPSAASIKREQDRLDFYKVKEEAGLF
jgi:hypothetical protein